MMYRVSKLQKILGQVAKDEPSRRFHSLYDKIYRKDVILQAWLNVEANGGSGGVDGKELEDYTDINERDQLLREIREELQTGTYIPQAVRREYIDKADGGKRPLGIPTIKDRVVQTAVKLFWNRFMKRNFMNFPTDFVLAKAVIKRYKRFGSG